MTNKDYYFLSKLAKAEKTIKQATVTTCTHKALTPTEPVAPTLGESDKIMYGQGSVAKTAAGVDPKTGDMGGSFTDAMLAQMYAANPITAIPNAAGALFGTVGPAGAQDAGGSGLAIIPGVAAHGLAQRRRQIDRERSGGKRDRSAQLHELAGSITNMLLLGLLGAGVGTGVAAYQNKGKEGESTDPNELRGNLLRGALYGGAAGAGVSGLATGLGSLLGVFSANKKRRENYLKNGGMWKNYLIPGYGGYQQGAGAVDTLKNT